MGQPVVHFEIIGTDPAKLRSYYGDLFGWEFDTSGPVSEDLSQPGQLRFRGAEHDQPAPGADLVVGHFTDPEGPLIGLAGTA